MLRICEVIWLKLLLEELKFSFQSPIELHCDNKAIISIANNPVVHHDRTKRVEVDWHFIKEKIDEGTISVNCVPTLERMANLLTKALYKPIFEKLVGKLGMFDVYTPAWEGVLTR